ncbi:MAG: ATP-binding cassette domain-containing protein, partial [Deltaproteobacteria bacterium]|nr:ATP-binding cassette domain-containing protein [Deltaproteobacteria bacterium]
MPPPPAAPAPSTASEEMAVLEGVTKAFDDREVLKGVDLVARPGEITVVVGGSGCGKSTLLRILLGLESYDGGSVRLLGREVSDVGRLEIGDLMMQVGMLFQFGALFDSMTVAENVGFALRYNRGLAAAEIRDAVRENLLMVGLKNVEELYPNQLSGGMRKRVALARAIAHHPRLLLVDEPTTGLDPIMADTINELILQMRDRLGVTVVCITHDIGAAFRIADHLAMLYQGKVIESGAP